MLRSKLYMVLLRAFVAEASVFSMFFEAESIAFFMSLMASASFLALSVGRVGATLWSSQSSTEVSMLSRSACGFMMDLRTVSSIEQATPTSDV